jgi:hypothetical protein
VPSEGSEASRSGPLGWVDLLVAGFFLIYAIAFFLNRWQGLFPFVFLGGDSGNIASYAVALEHPDLFVGDNALGDPDELGFYQTIHIPLLRLLGELVGDYGTAFIFLLGPHVWLQALGFYVLGRVLFRNRFWAFLLALVNLMQVGVGLSTYWGAYSDPQPRFSFQALLPFVLALNVIWRGQPRRWPWIMLSIGALLYVHPVSAPGWGFALWLGLWSQQPAEWSAKKRLTTMLSLGGLFLLMSAPLVVTYLGSREHGVPETVEFDVVYPILARWISPTYLDVKLALHQFAGRWWNASGLLWPCALVGVGVLWGLRGRGRALLPMLGLWVLGLVCVNVLLPYADQIHRVARHALPVQIDLIRGIRYLVPLALLLAFWPLAEAHERIRRTGRHAHWGVAVALVGLLLAGAWVSSHPPRAAIQGVACWTRGRLTCPPLARNATIEAIEVVRNQTPIGATLLASSEELPIRYRALRPVVNSRRDIGVLFYSKHEQLPRWEAVLIRRETIKLFPKLSKRFQAQMALAMELGADYVLLDTCCVPESYRAGHDYGGHRIVWRNLEYALVQVSGASRSETEAIRKAG